MEFAHRTETNVPCSNPGGEANISKLLKAFRGAGVDVCHIHHHSLIEGSPFAKGQPGAKVQKFAGPKPGEATYIKHVNSSFIGTSLEADLHGQ